MTRRLALTVGIRMANHNDYDGFPSAYSEDNETNAWNACYERPACLRLAGEVAGLRVLDAGCGSGAHASELIARGASLAKPCVPRVRSEPRVPDHQDVKWTQFLWRFHEPQGGIPFHHLPHAIGQCEDEFRD